MTEMRDTWAQVSDRLEALGLKLKLHLEQTSDGDLTEALTKLGQGVREAFEAAGNAVKDEAVRSDVRDVGRLFADAVSNTLTKVGEEVKDTFSKKS